MYLPNPSAKIRIWHKVCVRTSTCMCVPRDRKKYSAQPRSRSFFTIFIVFFEKKQENKMNLLYLSLLPLQDAVDYPSSLPFRHEHYQYALHRFSAKLKKLFLITLKKRRKTNMAGYWANSVSDYFVGLFKFLWAKCNEYDHFPSFFPIPSKSVFIQFNVTLSKQILKALHTATDE